MQRSSVLQDARKPARSITGDGLTRSRSNKTTAGRNNLIHFHWPKAKKTPNRLIDIHTLELKSFGTATPPYAILSHRWTEDEVTFENFGTDLVRQWKGNLKIVNLCKYIKHLNSSGENGIQDYTGPLVEHVWVDTCCIDKRSSAELSEAVNSMSAWYKHSAFCVAYHHDVAIAFENDWEQFRKSDWFTRGWTLQELIYPPSIAFCNQNWEEFLWMSPLRKKATELVSEISGVPASCLRSSRAIADESIATRMSWAANRQTTRKEDEAYCLLGLLDINMPLIYGEGERAFIRLQEEIIKQIDDESIFAWTMTTDSRRMFPLLAASPSQFKDCRVEIQPIDARKPYSVTNQGLQLSAPSIKLRNVTLGPGLQQDEIVLIQLNCCYTTADNSAPCCVALVKRFDNDLWRRILPDRAVWAVLLGAAESTEVCDQETFYVALDPMNRRLMYREAETEGSRIVTNLRKVLSNRTVDSMESPMRSLTMN